MSHFLRGVAPRVLVFGVGRFELSWAYISRVDMSVVLIWHFHLRNQIPGKQRPKNSLNSRYMYCFTLMKVLFLLWLLLVWRHVTNKCPATPAATSPTYLSWYIRVNKNPSAWYFRSPKPKVTCGTVAIIIRVVLLSPYLRIRAVSLSSIHYNQSHHVYINRRRQYICLIWN